MYFFSALVILLCIANGTVAGLNVAMPGQAVKFITIHLSIFLQIAFLLLWGAALITLYRRVREATKIEPDKRMFIIHGAVIGGNLLFYVIYAMLLQIGKGRSVDAKLTIDGFANICGIVTNFFEVAGFWLVVYVQIPLTQKQKERKKDIDTFVLYGFKNTEQLVEEIFKQNEDMSEEEQEMIKSDIDRFRTLVRSTDSTRSIIAELAIVPSSITYTTNFDNIRQGMHESFEIRPTIEAEHYDKTDDLDEFKLGSLQDEEDDVIDL